MNEIINQADERIPTPVAGSVKDCQKNTRKTHSRVAEIPTLRTANRKVFRMDDGSEQAVFCSSMNHERSDADTPLELDADGKHYRKRGGSFNAAFSCDETNDELFSMEMDTHRITISAPKNNGQQNAGKRPTLRNKAILFEDVAENIDMEYSVVSGGVKENIVVKQQANAYSYPFVIHCENVSFESDSTAKQVKFVSSETGEEVFFIPAPFMVDANGIVSTGVNYELENMPDGDIQLTIVADSDWINAQGRAFPVTIDPQVMVSDSTNINTYSWVDGTMTAPAEHTIGKVAVTDPETGEVSYTTNRMYLHFNMPTLPNNPRIKKAELVFYQKSDANETDVTPKLGLFRITENISIGTATPAQSTRLIDFEAMKPASEDGIIVSYVFDITRLMDAAANGSSAYQNLVIQALDESISGNSNVVLFGSADAEYAPTICVTYESSYAVNASYRTHTHEIGRFGQGSVDLACGNLMFEFQDFAWAGNRMPITLKHLYNSALGAYQYTKNDAIKLHTADFSAMRLGYGWKLNIMQSMMPASFQHEGGMYDGYVYVGEDGGERYFKKADGESVVYKAVDDSDLVYYSNARILVQGEEVYFFDTYGRLMRIVNKHSQLNINYTNNRISSVTDGIGRKFTFTYNGVGRLVYITAPDNSTIGYSYINERLAWINYPNGVRVSIDWENGEGIGIHFEDADVNYLGKMRYTLSNNRVTSVAEYTADDIEGNRSTYSYNVSARKTTVQTTEQADGDEDSVNTITTVYTFNDEGDVVSQYVYTDDTGNVGAEGEGAGINPYFGEGGVPTMNMSNNLLAYHGFETVRGWDTIGDISTGVIDDPVLVKFGARCIRVTSTNEENSGAGVFRPCAGLSAGTYTFSAYLRPLSIANNTEGKGAYLRVTDTSGNVIAESERLTGYDTEFVRMAVTFDLTETTSVWVQMLMDGAGEMYVDAAQLEANPYATAYNLLEDGNFDYSGQNWFATDGAEYSTYPVFRGGQSMKMTGDLNSVRNVRQGVAVKQARSTRETFTLSGWAKGDAVPNRERDACPDAQFRLRAVIHYDDADYEDTSSETFTADFSPCTEDWQYASVQFCKSKYRKVSKIDVFCDFDYNYGTVYFDDIQLVRDSLETDLSAENFASADDEIAAASEETETEIENPYTAPTFEELVDSFGNTLTETTYTDGEFGTIYRSFGYSEDGNDLIRETDARGNVTTYTVDPVTSRNQAITDRCGNQTHYEYDAAGRTTKVTSKNAQGAEVANVSYTYDCFDNLTGIVRGDGMKYALQYNEFHNLASIGVDGKTEQLVSYAYKPGNGRLKQITYANGDTMNATYNSMGQMVAERWYDGNGTLTASYKYGYDGQGNIVRSVDILCQKEYSYTYEEGRITRAVESDVVLNENQMIVSKTIVHTLRYIYDQEGNLLRKHSVTADGTQQISYCENDANDCTMVKIQCGDHEITSHSKTDSFGRKVFDELQLGTGTVSRQFLYHAGEATEEHTANGKIKSTSTTNLVSQIILSDGQRLEYEYDAEERITRFVQTPASGSSRVLAYDYDALGQLRTERVNGILINAMTYDNYGNILTKNGVTYTYGDEVWKDKLTVVGDKTISYDAQGNPASYLGHTLTWEKGRQLKSFDNNTYTYNANGIRTSKTVNGVKHTYTLDGAKILRETWGDNVLIPLYDNEDSVCGILYNDTPYYFLKNLQGDIISVTDENGQTVAEYIYDAWGVCLSVSDSSDCGIGDINPFRYRGYYYDAEIGMYYLQSRYYDSYVARYLNCDIPEVVCFFDCALDVNLYSYCKNNSVALSDHSGMFSMDDLYKKVSSFLQKLFNKFVDNLKKQFQITKKYIKISVTAIKLVLDLVLTWVVSKVLKWGIEKIIGFVMKKYIEKSPKDFVKFLGKVLNHSATKWLIKKLMLMAVNLGYLRSVNNAVKSVAVDTILSTSKVLSKINSICSACSSISGLIAFILDLADSKWDDYLTISFS